MQDNPGRVSTVSEVTREEFDALVRRVAALEAPGTELATTNGAPKRKRGARLPEDWLPSQESIRTIRSEFPWVTSEHLEREHRKFRDYWHSKTTGATKLDWEGTWRNWMRKAYESVPAHVSVAKPTISTVDQKILNIQAMKEPE